MSTNQEFDGYPASHFDEPPVGPRLLLAGGWWIAAVTAVVAVAGLIVVLSGVTLTPARVQAAQDRGRAEARVDNTAYGAEHAAGHAAKVSQVVTATKVKATETAAQAGALSADATAQDASAAEPAPR